MKFALIGDGRVAQYHRKAIEHVGGEIGWIVDPRHEDRSIHSSQLPIDIEANHRFYRKLMDTIDYYVICSPSQFHRQQIQYIFSNSNSDWKEFQIICEKPAFLPWENIIDDDRINIVLQLRYLPNLPEKADMVVAHFVRDEAYFKSWKGDPKNTGGIFTNLFIHYISIALDLGANFQGFITSSGNQTRRIDNYDILKIDTQFLYNKMYEDIVINNKGTNPKDLFLLNWILERCFIRHGGGIDVFNKKINLNLKDLII